MRRAPSWELFVVLERRRVRADEADASGALDLVFDVAEHFSVKSPQAKSIVAQVTKAAREWRAVARDLGLKAAEIERMASAFLSGN